MQVYRSRIDRWELVVRWDIFGLYVRAHSKPKLFHFVLALQASRRGAMARWIVISDEEEELRSLRRKAYCMTLPRLANWMWLQPWGSREPASPKMSL